MLQSEATSKAQGLTSFFYMKSNCVLKFLESTFMQRHNDLVDSGSTLLQLHCVEHLTSHVNEVG